MTAALAVALSSAGCNVTGRQKASTTVRTSDASYQSGKELPPDIKQILMAGGLDADNPSAPARPPVALAAADVDTMPTEDVVQVAANPPSRQVVMAARGFGPAQSLPTLAVGSGGVAPDLPAILMAASAKSGRTRVAAAQRDKADGVRSKVTKVASAKLPARPATKGQVPVPETQGSPIRFASINVDDDRSQRSREAKIPSRAAASSASSEAPPRKVVRRF